MELVIWYNTVFGKYYFGTTAQFEKEDCKFEIILAQRVPHFTNKQAENFTFKLNENLELSKVSNAA